MTLGDELDWFAALIAQARGLGVACVAAHAALGRDEARCEAVRSRSLEAARRDRTGQANEALDRFHCGIERLAVAGLAPYAVALCRTVRELAVEARATARARALAEMGRAN